MLFQTSKTKTPEVHFHQGPQGQPIPCYDGRRCTAPKLAIHAAKR